MNVDDAVFAVAHAYPGGVEALAVRMGKTPAVLRSKVNPHTETHVVTLHEALAMAVLTGDRRAFDAAAQELGCMLLPLPAPEDEDAGDTAVLELVAAVWGGQGDLGTAIHQALSDGRVTQRDMERIRSVAVAAQVRIAELVRRFESLAEPVAEGSAR